MMIQQEQILLQILMLQGRGHRVDDDGKTMWANSRLVLDFPLAVLLIRPIGGDWYGRKCLGSWQRKLQQW